MFGLNCSLKQTSIAPSQCCQKKELNAQRRDCFSETELVRLHLFVCRTCSGTEPTQPTQEPTQASLAAEGIAWKTFKLFALVWKFVGLIQCNDGINATARTSYVLVRWSTLLTVTRLGSVTNRFVTWNSWNRGSMPDKLRFFHVFCTSFGVPACQKQAICACFALQRP